jgi:hypothetical protein
MSRRSGADAARTPEIYIGSIFLSVSARLESIRPSAYLCRPDNEGRLLQGIRPEAAATEVIMLDAIFLCAGLAFFAVAIGSWHAVKR